MRFSLVNYFLLHRVAPSTSLVAIFCAFLYALHASKTFKEKQQQQQQQQKKNLESDVVEVKMHCHMTQ